MPRGGHEADTVFKSENYLKTAEVHQAFEVIRLLVDRRFASRVYIVSKCGPRVQTKTLRWMKHHRFFERAGGDPKHVHIGFADSSCRQYIMIVSSRG